MTNKKIQSEILKQTEKILNNLSKERSRNVIERRFGLKTGKRETLDAIGKNYGVTRERVRQIEYDAFKVLKEKNNLSLLNPIFSQLNQLFKEHNYLIGESQLLNLLAPESESQPVRSAVFMILTLGDYYERFNESSKFYTHWSTKRQVRKQVETIVDYLIKYFEQKNQTIAFDKAIEIISSRYRNIPVRFIKNSLEISKEISENIFKDLGLSHWQEINPRGVRDKAFLVLKKKNLPCHFVKIAELINEANFSVRQAFPQTVHNELIKDSRFVLIGRGTYALEEWGYEPGTVKDVIIKILADKKKPLSKNEIISAVLEKRRVKPNTIVISLQNNKEFQKLDHGKYILCQEF